jgi:hypothetical protein
MLVSSTVYAEMGSDIDTSITALQNAINADSTLNFTADIDSSGDLVLTANEVGASVLTDTNITINVYSYTAQ